MYACVRMYVCIVYIYKSIGCLCWVIVNYDMVTRNYIIADAIIGNCYSWHTMIVWRLCSIPLHIDIIFYFCCYYCVSLLWILTKKNVLFFHPQWIEHYLFLEKIINTYKNCDNGSIISFYVFYRNIEIQFSYAIVFVVVVTIYLFIYLFCFVKNHWIIFSAFLCDRSLCTMVSSYDKEKRKR